MKLFRSAFAFALSLAAIVVFAPLVALAAAGPAADLNGLVASPAPPHVDFVAAEMLRQAFTGGVVLFAIAALLLLTLAIPWRRRSPQRIRSALVFPFERSPRPPI